MCKPNTFIHQDGSNFMAHAIYGGTELNTLKPQHTGKMKHGLRKVSVFKFSKARANVRNDDTVGLRKYLLEFVTGFECGDGEQGSILKNLNNTE